MFFIARREFGSFAAMLRRMTLTLGLIAVSSAQTPPASREPSPVPSASSASKSSSALLAWDAESKSYDAKPGESSASFEFRVTNRATVPISILALHSSCGCTVAKLPPLPEAPLVLAPGATTVIQIGMDLTGKTGVIAKSVSVESSVGIAQLHVRANIPHSEGAPVTAARSRNIQLTLEDRQAVFRGDCAKCHATPAVGKMGEELYLAVCTLCHDASPRASMVPDLNSPRGPRDLAFWRKWIGEGAAGTMMPAFAAEHGGPLTPAQIDSLSRYVYEVFPKSPAPTPAGSP
jgi:hypothetical protein